MDSLSAASPASEASMPPQSQQEMLSPGQSQQPQFQVQTQAPPLDPQIEDLKRRIRTYDQMYARNQQEGKPFEALEFLEKSLFLRKELLGPEHPEVSKVCQVFTTSCNTLAMNALQKEEFMVAYELLKKAEILTSPNSYIHDKKTRAKLRAVTFNNFGCFYKRRGKLHAALQYLAKALKIELNSSEVDNPAGTHLNLCATLSQLGRHGPAMEHAQCALELLQNVQRERGAGDDASILAIAWHNLAVEQEHLSMMDDALQSYGEAVAVAEREWGPSHIKTMAIRHSFEEARTKAKARAKKEGPGASPLDALLNPSQSKQASTGKKGAQYASRSPLKKGGARTRPRGGSAASSKPVQKVTQSAAVAGWNQFLSGQLPQSADQSSGGVPGGSASFLPPIEEGGHAVSDGRTGPRTPPPAGADSVRPRRRV